MKDLFNKMHNMAKELQSIQKERMDAAYKSLKDIEDEKMRDYLKRSIREAQAGRLDINGFLAHINKLTVK